MRPQESFLSQSVRSLQTMLRVLAVDDKALRRVIPDGIYGSQTRSAVYQFQRSRGLPATGVTDQATWDRIVADYGSALVRLQPAQPLQILLEPGQVLRRGSKDPCLYVMQAVLKTLSEVYESLPAPSLSGILDEATTDSIASFQYLSGLPQTGQLDKITWKHMALQYTLAANLHEFAQSEDEKY